MKIRTVHIVIGLLLALVALSNNPVTAQTEESSNQIAKLDSLEHKLIWIERRLAQGQVDQLLHGQTDSLDFFSRLKMKVLENSFDENIETPDEATIGSVDFRRFQILSSGCQLARVDRNQTVKPTFDSLQIFFDHFVEPRQQRLRDSLRVVVDEVGRRSDRESAWRTLAAIPEDEEQTFGRLLRLRNQIAGKMGYRNYYSLVSQTMIPMGVEYGRRLDEIDSVTSRAYGRLINDLQLSYQPGSVEIWDLKSSFKNTMTEADPYFPADKQFDLVKATFATLGFDLANLPIYFHTDSVNLPPGEFKTVAVDVPNDIRVIGQPKNGFRSMTALMRAAGIAVYYTRIREDSPTFLRLVDRAWIEAIGDLFESMCYDEEWLIRFAQVPQGLTRKLKTTHSAFQLIDTRMDLVMARFEWDIYNSQIADPNDRYWEFFSDIMRLPKHDDLSPWATEIGLVNEPLSFYNRLMARSAASQTLNYLREDYPSLFSGQVGSFLIHNYFRFGNRYDWRELVERATGKPLSVAYLDDI